MLRKNALRVIVFFILFFFLLSAFSKIVTNAGDDRIYQFYGSFYAEKEDTLDAVYLGASTTYAYWSAPLAWERYGIAVHPFNCPKQPFEAMEYLIREVRKTQPDALYIVPITSVNDDDDDGLSDIKIHYVADYMPLSPNKIRMVRTLGGYMGLSWTEQMEFLFPFIRFHSRWSELQKKDFTNSLDGFKGASYYNNFLFTSTDISSSYRTTERTGILSGITQDALDSLMEYCDAEQINVLFIAIPNAQTNEYRQAQINSIKETVQARGYSVLDMRSAVEEIGIDLTKDYYNERHTNIHGAIKVTDYIARYLVENYDFEDKRGNQVYSSWDEAYDKYTVEYALANTLDVEWDGEPRDSTLDMPRLSEVTVDGTSLTVSWEEVPGADGYRIYRKLKVGNWEAVDTLAADAVSYNDTDCKAGSIYYYTVIAYREKDGIQCWGDYDFVGISGTALLDAPRLLDLTGSENKLTLTWEPVKEADGYAVFRRLPSGSWVKIADVGNDITFTDTDMLSDMPYQYTVKAYCLDETGSRVMGSYNTDGLLYFPELELPSLKATVENDVICLFWERIEGIQGYMVYRRTKNSDWEQLTIKDLPVNTTIFYDITAQADVDYAYKVEACIHAGEQESIYKMETGSDWIRTERSAYDAAMPEIVYLEQAYDQVYIIWEPVDGASSYRIWRRDREEDGNWSDWESVNDFVTGTSYLDKPSQTGNYEYQIQSIFEGDSLTYYGETDAEAGYAIAYSTIAE